MSMDTTVESGSTDNAGWIKNWTDGDVYWHQSKHDRFLDQKEEEMFEGKKKSVFLPLCGKSLDMLWMYKNGHTVSGVEIAELAIQQFFEENSIESEVETIENVGKLYKSKDGRIQLYVADLFEMRPELCGQFDIIFDSKSFVAINTCDRQKYIDVLLSLMKKDGRYYLSAIEYDRSVWPGPPHVTTADDIQSSFGDRCYIKQLVDADQVMKEKSTTADETPVPNQVYTEFSSALKASSYALFRWYKITFKQL